MQRYRIASMNGEDIAAVVTLEEFPDGPQVGATIPADEGNRDWREFLAWQAAGNEPDPMGGA